jgi:colanic acid/amylovoran biosynthesis glycosyltransferase
LGRGELSLGIVRIAYLISQYPAVNHTYILAEVRGLRTLGIEVETASILGSDRGISDLDPDEAEEAARTFYVRPLGPLNVAVAQLRYLLTNPMQYLRAIALAFRLGKWNLKTAFGNLRHLTEAVVVGQWMKRSEIHHLHTHFATTPALFLRALFPVGLSATIHGSGEFNDAIGFMIPEKVHASDFVIAISNYGCSQMMRVSDHEDWDKIQIARIGVDTANLDFTARPVNTGRPFEIISVGQLAPAKGTLILLKACKLLLDSGHNVILRLVGDGPDRKRLESAAAGLGISQQVIFEGAQGHHRVLELYRSADFFALASFAEGIPVVLMEAMAVGIPCVATRITGIPELIEDGVSGILVPPADAGSLAAALERLIVDPSFRDSLGRNAHQKIMREYNFIHNLERVKELFELHIPPSRI